MSDLGPIMHREDGSLILPSDPDALRVLVAQALHPPA